MTRLRIPRLTVWICTFALPLIGCGSDATKEPVPEDEDSKEISSDDDENDEDDTNDDGDELPIVEPPPINVAANDQKSSGPMDATPSPDGKEVYYTALATEEGERIAGIFHVPAEGGEIESLHVGAPLVAPVGVATSLDGETLFVADSAAGDTGFGGAILTLDVSGGTPAALEGTEGYAPQGLVIANVKGKERLYFTGRDPKSGEPSAFETGPNGGTVERLTDASLSDPGGIAVSAEGDVFVVDSLGGEHLASVYLVKDGEAERFVEGIGVGFPSGLTLTLDEETLIVSGLDPATKRDRVYFVTVKNGDVAVMIEPVSAFSESAGLHRAHDANVFAWADSEANGTGTVYVLKP